MARQILPIAGQIIGGMIGGPVGSAIGGAIGGAIGAYVDPLRHQGPKLGEARAQTSQEGVYRPLVFGTGCVSGNVIHRSDRKVVRHRERVGKGGRDTVDTDRGYRTFAIRIAEAHTPEGYSLLRVWENETLVYDMRPESEIVEESIEYAENFRFYSGTQDQLPDPDLEAHMGIGNVNAYRGSCYIVFGNYDLTDFGDMVPQYRFEISSVESVGFVYEYLPWQPNQVGRVWMPTDGTSAADVLVVGGGGSGSGAGGLTPSIAGPGGGGAQVVLATGVPVSGPVPVFVGSGGSVSNDKGEDSFFGDIVAMGGSRGDRGDGFNGGGGPAGSTSGSAPGQPGNGGNRGGDGVYTPGGQWGVGSGGGGGGMGGVGGSSPDGGGFGGPGIYVEQFGQYGVGGYFGGGGGGAYANPSIDLYVLDNGGIGGGGTGGMRINSGEDPIYAAQNGVDGTGGGGGGARFGDQGAGGDGGIYLRYAASTTDHLLTLAQIIEFCHRRVGQPASDYDVSELDDVVDGVVFADGYSARDAITTLLPIYNADASEHDRGSGYRINYIKRGSAVERVLTEDDLVDELEEAVREDPMERPRVLHMAFESPVTGYTAAKASIQRLSPDVRLVNEVSTYVPVTFKDVDEAWQRADVQMRIAWTEVNGERTFSISDAHLDLVSTDNIALSLRGQVQRLRILRDEYTEGVIKLESIEDRQSNYTSNVTGIPLPEPSPPPPSLIGPVAFAILDIPALSDGHDRLGYYVAVSGTTDVYAGAVIQRQQGDEYVDVVSLGRNQRAIMGVLENTVSAASPHYTDTTNVVSVQLHMDDELESLSNAQFRNKGGAFALETASGWEVLQYRDAEQDVDGVWHLTHLARGRLNTDPLSHSPGARFVLLDGVRFIDADVGMIGKSLTLRAAAVGRSPETAVPQTITYQGNSQREFPVAHLMGEVEGSTLSLSAVPRDRLGTETHPLRSINHDGFRWTVTDGVATVSADSDHDSASLDVSSLSSPITASVAQLNRFTGAGPTVSEEFE